MSPSVASGISVRALVAALLTACVGATDAQGSAQGPASAASVRVEVNAAAAHQVMEGFGATTLSLVYGNGANDKLPPSLRARALKAVYGDVRLTLGNVDIGVFEPANDDADPFYLNQSAFELAGLQAVADKLVTPAKALAGESLSLYPGNSVSLTAATWLEPIRKADYNRYLDESAEYVVAAVLKWRDATGDIPRYHALFNEPTIGNVELKGGGAQEMIDIIKRAGARLRAVGMPTKFIAPSEYSVLSATTLARAILADPGARQYVAAIGYHVYPYGSPYSSTTRILEGPGRGRRDETEIAQRRALRDLGRQYNLPLWMTEVSHGGVDPRTMDALRARAIAIHDELAYTDASAYFGMLSMWDSETNTEHSGPSQSLFKEEDTIALIDLPTSSVFITGMGYAIGHYARWVQRGAMRVESSSSDSLVLVSAFTDNRRGKASVVIINNGDVPKSVRVHLNGLAFTGPLTGEQSHEDVRWRPLGAVTLEGTTRDAFVLTVPARSVTSVGGTY